jgi:hypothetical protein
MSPTLQRGAVGRHPRPACPPRPGERRRPAVPGGAGGKSHPLTPGGSGGFREWPFMSLSLESPDLRGPDVDVVGTGDSVLSRADRIGGGRRTRFRSVRSRATRLGVGTARRSSAKGPRGQRPLTDPVGPRRHALDCRCSSSPNCSSAARQSTFRLRTSKRPRRQPPSALRITPSATRRPTGSPSSFISNSGA